MAPRPIGVERRSLRSRVSRRLRRLRSWTLSRPLLSTIAAVIVLSVIYFLATRQARQGRLSAISDGVFGGLIASLATYAIVQTVFLQRTAHSLRHWLQFGHRNVWIIPTTVEHPKENRYLPEPYYVVPPFDAEATGVLTHILRRSQYKYPQRQTIGSHVFDRELLSDNIVCLCLPSRNQYSRLILGMYHELYEKRRPRSEVVTDANIDRFGSDTVCSDHYFGLEVRRIEDRLEWRMRNFADTGPNRWLTSTINAEGVVAAHSPGNIATDYGFIVKGPNPFNPDAGALVVCGIHGIGTLGAALYLFEHSHKLLERHGDQPQVLLVEVKYAIPANRTNYIDARIHPPLLLVSHTSLNELGEYRATI